SFANVKAAQPAEFGKVVKRQAAEQRPIWDDRAPRGCSAKLRSPLSGPPLLGDPDLTPSRCIRSEGCCAVRRRVHTLLSSPRADQAYQALRGGYRRTA